MPYDPRYNADYDWQRDRRDQFLKPWYTKKAFEGRFAFTDTGKLGTELDRRGIDTVMQRENNKLTGVQEKIVRWPKRGYAYDAFNIEFLDCSLPGQERLGWMLTCEADYLFYCYAQSLDPVHELHCFFINFPVFKLWFWGNVRQFAPFTADRDNRAKGLIVPHDTMWRDIPEAVAFYALKDPPELELEDASAGAAAVPVQGQAPEGGGAAAAAGIHDAMRGS